MMANICNLHSSRFEIDDSFVYAGVWMYVAVLTSIKNMNVGEYRKFTPTPYS